LLILDRALTTMPKARVSSQCVTLFT